MRMQWKSHRLRRRPLLVCQLSILLPGCESPKQEWLKQPTSHLMIRARLDNHCFPSVTEGGTLRGWDDCSWATCSLCTRDHVASGCSSGEPNLWHSDLEFEFANFHQIQEISKHPKHMNQPKQFHEKHQCTQRGWWIYLHFSFTT